MESAAPPNGAREVEGTPPQTFTHVPALDGLRGVAVLLVVATHTVLVFWFSHFYDVVPGGFLGVDLFFVLSGFLITSLLLSEQARSGGVSVRGFYRRRALRLLPALFALLVVHASYTVLTGLPRGIEERSILATLVYGVNWYAATGHRVVSGLNHLWSLSIEEQFYLVWPLVTIYFLTVRRSLRTVATAIIAAIVAIAAWRLFVWHPGGNILTTSPAYLRTDTRADSILVGALAAHIRMRVRLPRRGLGVAAWISTAFIAYCAVRISNDRGFYYKGGFTLVAVAAAVVILASSAGVWSGARALSWAPLRAVGRVSYGLYLWHLGVFFAVRRYTANSSVGIQIALALAITAIMTLASWRFVETPFLRRKARA